MPQGVPVQAEQVREFFPERHGDFTDPLVKAVQPAPDHIGKTRSVPEAADQENDHPVQVLPEGALPASPEGNIKVIPEP